ncbi:glycosyltransferase family 4 protein [Frateuria sp. GZRe12]|uniref:glycosyltransferase family 4 protein n=1 Tax=Frateuria sp. GZRe12 TaxID=3351533 RepID=UPI003EDB9891
MEQLNWHMAAELMRWADVRIIGPSGCAALVPDDAEVREVPQRPLWRFLLGCQFAALREAMRFRPQVVLAGSGLTAVAALLAAKASGALGAVYLHGLDIVAPHAVYRHIWLPAIRRLDRVVVNSQASRAMAEEAGVRADSIEVVHPGVQLPDGPAAQVPCSLRHDLQLGEGPLLLSVGRLSSRKGLREFVSLALPRIVADRPGTKLLVVGDVPAEALHATGQSPESIRQAAVRAGVNDHVVFLGVITDRRRLAEVYRSADVHVFPVRQIQSDPEGFGMVAIEAAAHGLPTVAFATGGVVDAVDESRSGRLVAPGDYPSFALAVLDVLERREVLGRSAIEFAKAFAWPLFGDRIARALGL